jgi:hypothetical protein
VCIFTNYRTVFVAFHQDDCSLWRPNWKASVNNKQNKTKKKQEREVYKYNVQGRKRIQSMQNPIHQPATYITTFPAQKEKHLPNV